ncbi:MAG: Ig-like domain-containing protein [Bacteroidetes bacterium]|nr:Ig-like domain-containing protein [Bacteroidota bacterium]
MKYGRSITRLITALLLLVMACQNPEEEGPGGGTTQRSNIAGTVLRSDNSTGVPGVIVRDITQANKIDTTDALGVFSIPYDLPAGQSYSTTIFGTRPGFGNDSAAVTIVAGRDTSVLLVLVADSTSPPTTAGSTSGQPASIVLVGTDVNSISIRGTGVNESALLTFEVRDSLGNPVLGGSGPIVRFSLLGAPGGGEYLYPDSGRVSGTSGRVSTRLNSGTRPGVIQVVATTRNDSVLSSPARVTIASGPPYGPNASISRKDANLPGLLYDNERTTISVLLGDRYQNPVPAGTAVYFTTTGGIIQPTAYTDADGGASVELITANPRPAGGVAIIYARTIGDTAARRADSLIQLQIPVVFSGTTLIIAPTAAFAVPDSGSYSFAYQVQDANGNPLVAGTTIKVSLSGPGASELEAQGDVDVTMRDTDDPTKTDFNATIVDKTRGGTGGSFTVTIEVKGRNGDATHTFAGLALSTGGGASVPGSTSIPRSISLNTISARTLSVKGTGANESTRLTFVVRDSLGNPVGNPLDPTVKAYVTFSINPSTGLGGAFVLPTGDSTDVNGQVGVTFNSGSQAGVVQVVATTLTGAGPITASPVQLTIQGGLPTQSRFITSLDRVNMPGLLKPGPVGTITVQAADEFGNAVQTGTAIYFSTSLGLIKASATTDDAGRATAQLSGGVDGASNGAGYVTVQTLGKVGEVVRDSLPFLFTGPVQILNKPSAGFSIDDAGAYNFSFRVADINGNPPSSGTTVTVTAEGEGAGGLTVTTGGTLTFPDTRDSMRTFYTVSVRDKEVGGPSGPVTFTINVAGENGNETYSFTGQVLGAGQTAGTVAARRPATLELVSNSNPSVSIRGTGSRESSTLTFAVKDSLGQPINAGGRALVTFALAPAGGLGGGEFLSTTGDSTDDNGIISVTFSAGTRAGVLQVVAKTTAPGRPDTIFSSPVRLTISGGLPSASRVVATLSRINIPGLVKTGPLATVSVQAGDQFNNPVQSGTAFYFTTGLGLIQATATTNDNGQASVQLSGGVVGSPAPSDTVTVQTVGVGGASIVKKLPFIFTGAPLITGLPAPGFTIADSGSYSFTFTVADANGNPLSAGSTVQVTVEGDGSGGLDLAGDVSRTLPDTRNASFTSFSVTAQDKDRGGPSGLVRFKISVTGENGTAEATLAGSQLTTGQSATGPASRYVATLELESISRSNLSIRGTGAAEVSTLTFSAKDSTGIALDKNNRAFVQFSLLPLGGLGGGEFLSVTADSTNDNGRVSVTINAGTKSGVLQVRARTTALTRPDTVFSSPVRLTISGGLPDSQRVVVGLSRVNMPGLIQSGPIGTVSVQAGDKHNNPAQTGTAFYFTTNLGLIQANASTNDAGQATAQLSGGVVGASTGAGTITVQTVGENGTSIVKTLPFLFTGATQITNTPASGFTISDSGTYSFSFRVADANGNPLVQGSTIQVTAEGPGAGGIALSGDFSRIMPDTRDTSLRTFNVTATDQSSGGPSGAVVFRISVTSQNGDGTYSWNGAQLAAGQSPSAAGGSGYAGSIELVNAQPLSRILSVRGTGSNETATLTFVVKDSLGNPVDASHAATVTFSVMGGPGGGESLFPTSVQTSSSGVVSTVLSSGTKAGVVQIRAEITIGATTIRSAPVVFTIHGGLPVLSGMTVWTSAQNYSFYVPEGTEVGRIFARFGDRYGNPVQPNTAVYFKTNGGVITAAGFTTETGLAQATLYGGEPFPPGGIDTVTISTVDESGTSISKLVTFVFSRGPVVTVPSVPTDTITILDGGFIDLDYVVADAIGNPLAQGNNVAVSVSSLSGASAGVSTSGDVSFVTSDARLVAATKRRVRLADNTPNGGVSGLFEVTITVNGPNGSTSKKIYGNLGAPQAITPPSPTVKNPAQIAFIGVSSPDIFVSGVGALENSVITYEVRDSLGNAIEATPRSFVNFSLTFFPNTWVPGGTSPFLIPGSDSTDNSGRARVSLSSGSRAGVVQIVARTVVGVSTITSLPVKITIHAGFPDQRHYTMAPEKYNFPGLDRAFVTEKITVQVADKYSNPVQAGTAVYFYSTHGTMTTGGGSPGLTDVNGFVSQTLYSANPYPEGADSLAIGKGFTYVYSQTLGDSGLNVIDSLEILWTGAPIITRTSGPLTFAIADGGSDGPWEFTVVDRFGHPMSSGTSISVNATDGKVSGDADIVMPDTKSTGPGLTSFTVVLSDGDPGDSDPPAAVLLTVIVTHPVYGTYKRVISSGTIN